MSGNFTEYCISELKSHLSSELRDFHWTREEAISGGDFGTSFDICGKGDCGTVLVQFEMHREGVSTNALKAAYCLERDRRFGGKRVLVIHVLSPFHEKPPVWETRAEDDRERFERDQQRRSERHGGRRNACTHKLLCFFLKEKGILDTETTTYAIVEWRPEDPQVREATIVLPRGNEDEYPAQAREAIRSLGDQLGRLAKEWQRGIQVTT